MSALDDAIAAEMQHPSGTMEDPLTAALCQCQCQDDFWAQRRQEGEVLPGPTEHWAVTEARDATRLPSWFWLAMLLALLLVPLAGCGGGDWDEPADSPIDTPTPGVDCNTQPQRCV